MHKPIAAFAAAGALVGGLALTPTIVGAQTDTAPAENEATEPHDWHAHGPRFGRDLLETTDVDRETLREAMRAGATLGEALTDQGIDLDELRVDAAAAIQDRLDEAVEAGRLTQAEADEKAERAAEHLDDRLDATVDESDISRDDRPFRHRPFGDLGRSGPLDDLDIDRDALREAIESGSTLAEALTAQGVDIEQLLADVLAAAQDRLDEALAAGSITQAQADRIQERLDAAADGSEFPFGNRGRRGGFDGFRGNHFEDHTG